MWEHGSVICFNTQRVPVLGPASVHVLSQVAYDTVQKCSRNRQPAGTVQAYQFLWLSALSQITSQLTDLNSIECYTHHCERYDPNKQYITTDKESVEKRVTGL